MSAPENEPEDTFASQLFGPGEHFLGNPDAPIIIVEYAEVECPFCKKNHAVLERILADYREEVVWVFRHFPLASHPKSAVEALALECVNEISGKEAFWEYLALLFETTPSNNNMDLSLLPELAFRVGTPTDLFESCMADTRHQEKIQKDRDSGILWGVDKVPHTILIGPAGQEYPISGARSYDTIKELIDVILQEGNASSQ